MSHTLVQAAGRWRPVCDERNQAEDEWLRRGDGGKHTAVLPLLREKTILRTPAGFSGRSGLNEFRGAVGKPGTLVR